MQQHLRDRQDLYEEKILAGQCSGYLCVKHETFRFCLSICVTQRQAMSERHKGGRKTTRQVHRSNPLQQVQLTSITFFRSI